jgi:hypothetical protein
LNGGVFEFNHLDLNRSQLPFGAGDLAGDSWIILAGEVDRAGKGLKKALHHMVRFAAMQEFQMEIALRFIGEALKELPRQAKAEGG